VTETVCRSALTGAAKGPQWCASLRSRRLATQ
jgi:hypothetical protein